MKKINKQADLSSSEDEASTNSLKEAIDQNFLNNNLYSLDKVKVILSSEAQINNKLDKNSLKINLKPEHRFTNFGVTATFQSFIAKKLDEILERTIELKSNESINCCDKQKRKRRKSYGIKLLSTSTKLLTVAKVRENYMEHEKRSKRNKQITKDNKDVLWKFREVAVDSEHILSKLDTKVWINKRPEPEFKYKKLKNGTLIEI